MTMIIGYLKLTAQRYRNNASQTHRVNMYFQSNYFQVILILDGLTKGIKVIDERHPDKAVWN
jgi:hypothetical protein